MREISLKKAALFLLIPFSIIGLSAFYIHTVVTARTVINNMYVSVDKIKSLKFTMKKKERVNGKILTGEQSVKFQRSPKRIYTNIVSPNKGVEVLYVEGTNNNNAYVNPNAFPFVTLSLNPYGSAMRNNNHHTVHEVGFDYIHGIVKHIDDISGPNFNKYFQYLGDTVFNNRKCYKILIDYKPFKYGTYTVKKGETLKEIAYRHYISDYMIMSINKGVNDYDDVKEGQVIIIPNAYSRKTYLFIDQKTFFPLVQIMYDEKGLFAQYEFYNLILNPVFSDEEFSKDYEGYDL